MISLSKWCDLPSPYLQLYNHATAVSRGTVPGSAANRANRAKAGAAQGEAIAAAQSSLDQANADVDLVGKLYGNKNARLTPEERKRLRELGINDPSRTNYKDLEKARSKAFDAQERLKALQGTGTKKGDRTKISSGPMGVKEATKPLTASERSAVNRELRGNREAAQRILQQNKSDLPRNATLQDIQAIRSYTADGYVGVNGAMRGLQSDPTSAKAQQQRLLARATNQAVSKMPKYSGDLRRDTRLPNSELKNYQVGNTVSFKGITSTTTDLTGGSTGSFGSASPGSKAATYGTKAQRAGVKTFGSDGQQVEFRISARNGRNIAAASGRGFEREVVLPHGWQGTVTSRQRVGNKLVISLSEA